MPLSLWIVVLLGLLALYALVQNVHYAHVRSTDDTAEDAAAFDAHPVPPPAAPRPDEAPPDQTQRPPRDEPPPDQTQQPPRDEAPPDQTQQPPPDEAPPDEAPSDEAPRDETVRVLRSVQGGEPYLGAYPGLRLRPGSLLRLVIDRASAPRGAAVAVEAYVSSVDSVQSLDARIDVDADALEMSGPALPAPGVRISVSSTSARLEASGRDLRRGSHAHVFVGRAVLRATADVPDLRQRVRASMAMLNDQPTAATARIEVVPGGAALGHVEGAAVRLLHRQGDGAGLDPARGLLTYRPSRSLRIQPGADPATVLLADAADARAFLCPTEDGEAVQLRRDEPCAWVPAPAAGGTYRFADARGRSLVVDGRTAEVVLTDEVDAGDPRWDVVPAGARAPSPDRRFALRACGEDGECCADADDGSPADGLYPCVVRGGPGVLPPHFEAAPPSGRARPRAAVYMVVSTRAGRVEADFFVQTRARPITLVVSWDAPAQLARTYQEDGAGDVRAHDDMAFGRSFDPDAVERVGTTETSRTFRIARGPSSDAGAFLGRMRWRGATSAADGKVRATFRIASKTFVAPRVRRTAQ